MQIPDTLLAAELPPAAKTVLTALWSRAEGEPAWTAPMVTELAARVRLDTRYVERLLVLLAVRGAVRREARDVGARRLLGFGLSRSLTPLQSRPVKRPGTTGQHAKQGVAKRERTHVLTEHDDMLQIARVAGRGDSQAHIAKVLRNAGAPCSKGAWHHVKVHRRISKMADELGITTPGAKAGDVVARWRQVAEHEAKKREAARDAATPDAKMDFKTEEW